tara:strand:+ start:444 stop:668 length:225 start_codon:yes stop_codon:yes gene_type:complete
MSITCSGCDAFGDGIMAGFIFLLIVILLAYLILTLRNWFNREELQKIKQEQEEIMLENRRRYFEDIGRDLDELH